MASYNQQGNGPRGVRSGGRRGMFRRKVCAFCVSNIKDIGYKDPSKLRPYISHTGKIQPRRKTGVCARHQRTLAMAIKRARHLALLPYVPDHIYRVGSIGVES